MCYNAYYEMKKKHEKLTKQEMSKYQQSSPEDLLDNDEYEEDESIEEPLQINPPQLPRVHKPVTCSRSLKDNPIIREIAAHPADGCSKTEDQLYLTAYQNLKRRNRQISSAFMVMGNTQGGDYADYFQPGFNPNSTKPVGCGSSKKDKGACKPAKSVERAPQEYSLMYKTLRHNENKLKCGGMIMGPHSAFPEFFPPGYDFGKKDDLEDTVVQEKGSCGGNRPLGPFNLNTKCKLADYTAIGYVPWYLKMHARLPDYCIPDKLKARKCSHVISIWR